MMALRKLRKHVGRISRNGVIRQEPLTALGGLRYANPPYVFPWLGALHIRLTALLPPRGQAPDVFPWLSALRIRLAAALLLAACGPALAEPNIGRLFNTRAERYALDANRGKAPAAASFATALPTAAAGPQVGPSQAGVQIGPSGVPLPGLIQAGIIAPGLVQPVSAAPNIIAPGMAASTAPGMPPEAAPNVIPAGANAAARDAAPQPPPPPEQLELNGVLRTSSGRSTVWLNNVPRSGAQNKFSNRNNKALTVTLPSGKKVLLQPGQRYDLSDGRVKDVNEP